MDLLKIFIVILINAGGEGKTTVARLIRALFRLSGQDHLGLDADHGNFALKSCSGADLLTKAVGWQVGPGKASEIVETAGVLPVIMDSGANMLASQREIVDLLPALRARFEDKGYRTVAMLPISPNKIAAAGALRELAPKLSDFETFVVKNNRDGSGEFGEVTVEYPMISVPHLSPGLNAYLTRTGREISDVIIRPSPGYATASAHIADWVRAFASDPNVQDVLGAGLCQTAISRLPAKPRHVRFSLKTFEDVHDESFLTYGSRSDIMNLLDRHTWTSKGLRAAADELDRRSLAT